MTTAPKPFPSQDFDALDGFDLDDEFMDLHPTGAGTPAPSAMGQAVDAFDPVGRMRTETEAAMNTSTPSAAVAPPVVAAMPAVETSTALTMGGAASVEVSIPRIGVHIFAERQDTAAAAERAGQDRRMA
ncbi:MAG: hypothetical protein HYU61_00990, partial [Brevundimonas diminuta]|nr:hypothetical protein [Brevundimonas diminuta]